MVSTLGVHTEFLDRECELLGQLLEVIHFG
jgi:hypothetical protein